ncbi:ROK family transcriptional regulator [Demequina sp. NBRC 110052]|uniref:ROK family transcriptional regulator n=1 Tax=Demequina sp. NBRC 110052 TaxID=1570341 RepID=UPI0013563EF6|nr:ROK family transcriptional regulator [Demequina sp. NBRC 110052]
MTRRGTNLPRMGDYNQAVVLDLVRRSAEGLSRAQIARRAGLSAQTISNITARLVADGTLLEVGARTTVGLGRPGTVLTVDPDSNYAVGVHVDPALVTCVLVDMAGVIRARAVHRPGPEPVPADAARRIASLVLEVMRAAKVKRESVLGVGVVTPGPIDLQQGLILSPPNLPHWDRVPLRDLVSEATGMPTLLDKDTNASAFAHVWFPAAGASDSYVFVYLGTGIGMSTVLANEVVRGRTGNAGDVGSLLVGHEGRADPRGRVGTLGQLAQASVVLDEAIASGALDGYECDGDSADGIMAAFRELGDRADLGDERAAGAIRALTLRMIKGARDFAHLLEIDQIILGGPLWTILPTSELVAAQEYVDAQEQEGRIWAMRVATSPWGDEVAAVGAASIVLEQAFAPRPANLLLDGR